MQSRVCSLCIQGYALKGCKGSQRNRPSIEVNPIMAISNERRITLVRS